MKEVYPNYYEKFHCIADRCKHSCCIGWEIDIDENTMDLYHSLDGEMGEKIRQNITGDVPHFILTEEERCPFLNEKGLCDIISNLGDGALSDICYLHPRFSSFHETFTETGLGLSCEEAARIILTEKEKFSIPLPIDATEDEFFKTRQEVFDILQNREISILTRLETLAEKYGMEFQFSGGEVYDFYMSLERLDERWEQELRKFKEKEDKKIFEREDLQIFFEQLASYFIFRHFESDVGFALLSTWVLGMLCSACETQEEMLDAARMYSSEIEYSEENTQKVKEWVSKHFADFGAL